MEEKRVEICLFVVLLLLLHSSFVVGDTVLNSFSYSETTGFCRTATGCTSGFDCRSTDIQYYNCVGKNAYDYTVYFNTGASIYVKCRDNTQVSCGAGWACGGSNCMKASYLVKNCLDFGDSPCVYASVTTDSSSSTAKCMALATGASCGSPKTCTALSKCVCPTDATACTTLGTEQCVGITSRKCQSVNGCLVWSAYTSCADCHCTCGGYATNEGTLNGNCGDSKDNDCDGAIDMADTGCCTANGGTCTTNTGCCSGYCKSDYSGSTKYCASSTQCVHSGTAYNNGAYAPDCYDPGSRLYCNSGTWSSSSCGTDVCVGTCPGGCTFTDYSCLGGSCSTTSGLDCDGAQQRCDSCKGTSFWNLGGDVAGTTCCGDDTGENKKTRSCTSGCTSDASDDACCDLSSDCVSSSTCYSDGSCNGALKCGAGSWVSHCSNGVMDCDETGVDCGGASCGACCTSNGGACTQNSGCCSGNCKSDYDTVGTFCSNSDQCVHDVAVYNNGVFGPDCYDSGSRWYCSSGTWLGSSCGTDGCSGTCPGGCTYTDYSCSLGSCGSSSLDSDSAQLRCDSCKGSGFWNLGGDVAGVACCGDDNGENKKTRSCTSGCTSDASDDACCDSSTDCVYSSACYSDGSCNGALKCGAGSWVSHCSNGVMDCDETGVDCGGASCGACCTSNGGPCTQNSECCSGNCKSDYSGSTKYCASSSQCVHNGAVFDDAAFAPDCYDSGSRRVCSSGTWSSSSCGADGCSGTCPGGCTYTDYSCSLGSCGSSSLDSDSAQLMCDSCKGSGYWNIGGDIAATACCGDEINENKKTRSCTSGCTSDASDDACCDSSTDCVYSSACSADGSCNGALKCNAGSWVSHCSNGVKDCDETGVDCGGASCGDTTPPTYVGSTFVSGAYVSGSDYWVKVGDNFKLQITHSDACSGVKSQYLSFTHNDCAPGSCSGAPGEIRSYTSRSDGFLLHDDLIDNTYLDIDSVICADSDGNCLDDDSTFQWNTNVKTSSQDWDYKIHTAAFDLLNIGGTYTDTSFWLKIDNTVPSQPTISLPISSVCQGPSPILTWSASSDLRSGISNYKVQVDNTNNAFPSPECTASPTSSPYSGCSLTRGSTYYFRVRAMDNVRNNGSWSPVTNFNIGESICDGKTKLTSCGNDACTSTWLNTSKQCGPTCTCAYTSKLKCDASRECATPSTCGGVAYTCQMSNSGIYQWVSGSLGTETSCSDTHDNDCDGQKDIYDKDCKKVDGQPCTLALECKSGLCDNDGKGANYDPYKDDGWCFNKTQSKPFLDNQDFNCENSTHKSSAVCDEFRNGTDCSYLDGRHLICNKVCQLENRDTSQRDCQSTGVNCINSYTWIKAGETGVPRQANKWEYTLNDLTTQQCCGDDTNETVNSRKTGCITNCATNDYPPFATLPTDTVCCNSPRDCVYSSICFTSSPNGGASQVLSGETLFCDTATWYDCDTSQQGCESYCGKKWLLSGEPVLPEYDSNAKLECCGDDSGENKVNSTKYTGHLTTDVRCCSSGNDCVLNGVCMLGYQNGGSETSCYDGIDTDCNGATDFCDGRYNIGCSHTDGLDSACESIIWGKVKGVDGLPISGVKVISLTNFRYKSFSQVINFTTVTDANGDFSLTAYGNSTYNIVAQKAGYYMIANMSKKLNLGQDWQLDIMMAKDMECRYDCTKTFDGLCHAECNGINGCNFFDYIAKAACNLNPKHAMVDYEGATVEAIECCTGSPKTKPAVLMPQVNVKNATFVQRLTKPVLFRGKLSQMIIVTYN